jgi:hypothetical protein
MTMLQNFPMVSQRSTVTGDGKASEDALYACVAASIDALCRYLLNTPENSVFNPDKFKDAAYGDAWIGGTSAEAYIPFCKSLGINLYPVSVAGPQAAVAKAHQLIGEGKPVIFTITDPYVDVNLPQYSNWTHVEVWYADEPGGLTAMDPWLAQPVFKSDGTWQLLLRSDRLWLAERIDDMPPPITLGNPVVASYFTQSSATSWHCTKTNKALQDAILAYYQYCGVSNLHGLLDLGLPVSNEIPIEKIDASYQSLAGSGIVVQFFERGVLIYDVKHLIDNPPGAGSVYCAHLYGLPGQDPLIKDLKAQIATLQGQEMPQLHAAILQIKEIVAPL